MMQLLIAILATVLLSLTAHAGPVTLQWDPVIGANGYEIEQSTDNGTTWVRVLDLTPSVCVGNPVACKVVHNAPDTGRVLFRFSAKNSGGKTTRNTEGIWHCNHCAGPGLQTGVGTQ